MAANTITGTVERVELIGHSHYGNPYYNVGIHADDETPAYNTYALVDGCAYDDDSSDTVEEAYAAFDALLTSYKADARMGLLSGDATIHLYDPFWGNMIAETHVSQYADNN